MFYRLESFVRGILQKRSIGLKETSIQRAYSFMYFAKKSKSSKRPKEKKRKKGEENQFTKRKTQSCVFSGFDVSISLG